LVAAVLFVITCALLGLAGGAAWNLTVLGVLGKGLVFGITCIPLTTLIFGILGVLPGTKKAKESIQISQPL
jgi:hypothetical protein